MINQYTAFYSVNETEEKLSKYYENDLKGRYPAFPLKGNSMHQSEDFYKKCYNNALKHLNNESKKRNFLVFLTFKYKCSDLSKTLPNELVSIIFQKLCKVKETHSVLTFENRIKREDEGIVIIKRKVSSMILHDIEESYRRSPVGPNDNDLDRERVLSLFRNVYRK